MVIKAIVLTTCQSRKAGVFKGGLSHEEIGTKYFDFSVMSLWLFIFTTQFPAHLKCDSVYVSEKILKMPCRPSCASGLRCSVVLAPRTNRTGHSAFPPALSASEVLQEFQE